MAIISVESKSLGAELAVAVSLSGPGYLLLPVLLFTLYQIFIRWPCWDLVLVWGFWDKTWWKHGCVNVDSPEFWVRGGQSDTE